MCGRSLLGTYEVAAVTFSMIRTTYDLSIVTVSIARMTHDLSIFYVFDSYYNV